MLGFRSIFVNETVDVGFSARLRHFRVKSQAPRAASINNPTSVGTTIAASLPGVIPAHVDVDGGWKFFVGAPMVAVGRFIGVDVIVPWPSGPACRRTILHTSIEAAVGCGADIVPPRELQACALDLPLRDWDADSSLIEKASRSK